MVDTDRLSGIRVVAAICFVLISTTYLDPSHAAAAPGPGQTSTSKSRSKSRHAHARPVPEKPIPLDELKPVPIELGDSGSNPLKTFFQALMELKQQPAATPTPHAPVENTPPPASPEAPTQPAPQAPAPEPPQAQAVPQSQASSPDSKPPAAAPDAPPQSPPTPAPESHQAQEVSQAPAGAPDSTPPTVVRVIHFGDSHVASDYWAGVLRLKLQARFGDAGPGFVLPGRPWSSIRYAQARSLDGQGWRTDDLRYTERDGVVGLGGMSIESYREASPASAAGIFTHFQVFAAASPGSSCFTLQVDDATVSNPDLVVEHIVPAAAVPPAAVPTSGNLVPEPSPKSLGGGAGEPAPVPLAAAKRGKKKRRKPAVPQGPPFAPWPAGSPLDLVELSNATPLAIGTHQLSIRSSCGPQGRVLGVELSNNSKGVLYDTDGVNGARLADLEKTLPALRTALLKKAEPDLIIVSYGTNDIGMKGFTAGEYEERVVQILTKLKQDAGDASILVTGPTDRGVPRKRTRALLQASQQVLQPVIRKAALRAGCAYWDQQAAMGGSGIMPRWVRAGLGNRDYVHFTGMGYQKLADMLYDQLMIEYENFVHSPAQTPPPASTP
jgi:lysophospholipase L1-like esterase